MDRPSFALPDADCCPLELKLGSIASASFDGLGAGIQPRRGASHVVSLSFPELGSITAVSYPNTLPDKWSAGNVWDRAISFP